MKHFARISLIPIATLLLSTLASPVHAARPRKHYLKKRRYQQTRQQAELEQTKQKTMNQNVTPIAGAYATYGLKYHLDVTYLYWEYNRLLAPIDTVTSGVDNGSAPSMNSPAALGHVWEPLHDFGSGFKVSLGAVTPHDGLDVRAEYVWNRFNINSTFNTNYLNGGNGLNARQSSAQLNNHYTDRLDYNKVNLEVGRDCKVSPKLSLRPHLGLTGAWQRSRWTKNQNAGEVIPLPNDLTAGYLRGFGFSGTVTTTGKYSLWGVGIRTGLNSVWQLHKYFALYANAIGNALWTERELTERASVFNSTANRTTLFSNESETVEKSIWVTEFESGIRFTYPLFDEQCNFTCQVGWEAQNWLNVIQGSDISFQGVNVKLRFDF